MDKKLLIEELVKEVLSTHKRLRCNDVVTTAEFITNEEWDDNSLCNFLTYSNLKTPIGKTYLSYNLTLESYIVHGLYQKIKELVNMALLKITNTNDPLRRFLYTERLDHRLGWTSLKQYLNFYYTLISNPSLFITQSRRLLNYYQIKGVKYLNNDSKYSVLDIFIKESHFKEDQINEI